MTNPYQRLCPKCHVVMVGPYAWSDGKAEIDRWDCPRCGHRCERFKWEYSSEQTFDPTAKRERPYWMNEARFQALRARLRR